MLSRKRQIFLYAEDSENDRLLIKAAITKTDLPIELNFVRDGEEAIRYLSGEGMFSERQKHPVPTLLLLNILLPKKDGFQVLEWLRQQPHLKRTAVIVLSVSRRQEDVDRAHDAGANAVLVKPATLVEWVDIVRDLSAWVGVTLTPQIESR